MNITDVFADNSVAGKIIYKIEGSHEYEEAVVIVIS